MKLPWDEIARRRQMSIAAMQERDRKDFELRHQARCDRLYWTTGQCCAGCDHWEWYGGKWGTCSAAGIVSGADVLRSSGIEWSSYIPAPGFPHSRETFWCGKFQDTFDWDTLGEPYLESIGAMANGKIKPKPQHRSPFGKDA